MRRGAGFTACCAALLCAAASADQSAPSDRGEIGVGLLEPPACPGEDEERAATINGHDRFAAPAERGKLAPTEPAGAEAPLDPQGAADTLPRVSGSVLGRYRTRRSSQEEDRDGFVTLMLQVDAAEGVELFVKGDVYADAGRETSDENRLADVWDSWDSSVQGRLQEGYLRLNLVKGLEVRLGRQIEFRTRTLQFDGLSASLAINDVVTLRALGGVPVYFYKSRREGDLMAAASVEFSPSAWTKLSLDCLHVTERTERAGFVHDNVFTVSARQRVARWATLRGRVEILGEELRAAEASALVSLADLGLQLRARYSILLARQEDRTNDLDPFSAVVGPENPYQRVDVSVWKDLWEGALEFELFYGRRQVTDAGDGNLWNRDYQRYGAAIHVNDVPIKGLRLTMTWEQWDVVADRGDRGNDTQQLSGELGFRATDAVRISAGSSYLLYRYDRNSRSDREDVRVYFARVRVNLGAHRFDLLYEFEDTEFDEFHTFRLGYRHDF